MLHKNPFLLPRGIELQKHSLKEGYKIEAGPDERREITANMSADHMADGLTSLFRAMEYPGFLILETPATRRQEQELANPDNKVFHQNVYYWDGLEKEEALGIFTQNQELLIHDGLSNFGFGSHMTQEEVFIGRYKTLYIWTKTPEKFRFLLEGMGIGKRDRLFTLGDFIHRRNPCDLHRIDIDNKSIYGLVDDLLPKGLYLAKTVED